MGISFLHASLQLDDLPYLPFLSFLMSSTFPSSSPTESVESSPSDGTSPTKKWVLMEVAAGSQLGSVQRLQKNMINMQQRAVEADQQALREVQLLQERVQDFKTKLVASQAACKKLQQSLQKSEESLQASQQSFEKTQADKRALQKRIATFEQTAQEARQQVQVLQQNVDRANLQVENLQRSVQEAERRAEGAERRTRKAGQVAEQAERRERVARQVAHEAERRERIARQEACEAERRERIATQEAQVAERRERIARQEAREAERRERIATQEAQEAERWERIATQEAQETERRANEVRLEAQEVERRANEVRLEAQEAERRANEVRQEAQEAESRANEVRQEAQEAERRANEVRQEAQEAERRAQEVRLEAQEAERRTHEASQEANVTEGDSPWVVQRDEILLTDDELGRGGWAVVRVARFRAINVAAKCLYSQIVSDYNRHLFIREMNMAARVRHPNLLQFIGATLRGELIILTELMPTSMRKELENEHTFSPNQITSISLDVARALNYLHLMHPTPIIHRDISSANVLLEPGPNNTWRAKVSDYGSVNLLQRLRTATPGNPTYAAPEAANATLQSPKMDIFSFGVLLVEMCTTRFPDVDDRERLIQSIQQPNMVALIRQCLAEDGNARPSAHDIITELNETHNT